MMPLAQHSAPKVLEAVSVFLCPFKPAHAEAVQRVEQRWQERAPTAVVKASDDIRLFHDDDWGEEAIVFSTGRTLRATVCPRLAWIPHQRHDWVVLALEATLHPEAADGSGLLLDDLLLFNVGFRQTLGEPEPQDSFFGLVPSDVQLSDGRPPSALYESQARKIIGACEPLPHLKKAVLLSYAKFDRPLSDQDLYRFGSIAYPQEPLTATWSKRWTSHIFDRWRAAGWRCFVYSYSLVYALDAHYAGREDASIRQRFLNDYTKMGVAIAMQRAWLQEFPQRLHKAADVQTVRRCHQELIDMQSRFGVRWTPEGTQRMTIEALWRKASGVDDRIAEVTQLLEQKVDVLEAEATDRVNTTLLAFQRIFGLLAGGQIGVNFAPKWLGLLGGAIGGLLLCWPVPWLSKKLKGNRDE